MKTPKPTGRFSTTLNERISAEFNIAKRSDESTFQRLVAPEPAIAPPAPPKPPRRPTKPPLRGKLPALIEGESITFQLLCGVLALAILIGFWAFTLQFHVPAH